MGKKKTNYRLKDWGISRQRYWGCPIPIAYNEKNEVIKIPENQLPIRLPEEIDLNTKGNPLDAQNDWKTVTIDGKKYTRETDTLDTFVDSSWYFLRFCSAKNTEKAFDAEDINYWMPVDQYIGGIEHAILHLLYSRFFMRAISLDNESTKIKEPFSGLFTQGMVCHQTYKNKNNKWLSPDEVVSEDGKKFFEKTNPKNEVIVGPSESMSKSKRNTIDPEKMINDYGADAVRLFILSDSPPEKDIQWSENGMSSAFKYIQKFWSMNEKILSVFNEEKTKGNNEINVFTNQSIEKINYALEKFRYNVIVAVFHEIYNFFNKISEKQQNFENLKENYKKILIVMMPVIPHMANECLEKLENKDTVKWPKIEKKYIENDKTTIAIQVNGKKRGLISANKDIEEQVILSEIKERKLIEKYIKDKKIFKVIYVKNKIINIIIK